MQKGIPRLEVSAVLLVKNPSRREGTKRNSNLLIVVDGIALEVDTAGSTFDGKGGVAIVVVLKKMSY